MLKLFQLALLFILMLPFVNPETEIFSGKIITDTDVDVDGMIFVFKYSPENDKMFVLSPQENIIVENGGCKSGNVFRVCINRVNFSYKNITTYVYHYESDLDVYKLTASLETIVKSNLSEMLQGETVEITVTIKNPANSSITKIDFSQDFKPFEVMQPIGCTLNGTKLSWKGSLEPYAEQSCRAKVFAKNEGQYTFTGSLNYFNGANSETRRTSLTVEVLPEQLGFSIRADNETQANGNFFVNFSLKNLHDEEDMIFFLQFKLPNNVELANNLSGFSSDSGIVNYSAEIGPGEEEYPSLKLKALSGGNASISYKITYTIKGISSITENQTSILIKENMELAPAKDINASPSNLTASANATNTEQTISVQNESKGMPKPLLLSIGGLVALILLATIIFIIKKKRNKANPEYQEAVKELQEKLK